MNGKGKNIGAVIFVGLLILLPFSQVFMMLYVDFKRSIELSHVAENSTGISIWIYSVFGLLALALLALIIIGVNAFGAKKKVVIEGNNIVFYKKDLIKREFSKTKEICIYDISYIKKNIMRFSEGDNPTERYDYQIVDKQGGESRISESDVFENSKRLTDYLINELAVPVKENVETNHKKDNENEQGGKLRKFNNSIDNFNHKMAYFVASFVIVLATTIFSGLSRYTLFNNEMALWIFIFCTSFLLTIVFLKSIWARRILLLLLVLYFILPVLYSKAPWLFDFLRR